MKIGKYNIAPGSGSNASIGATAVAGGNGGGASVDLTPLTDKIAALESKVSQLELQLGKANAVLAGLDSRFLSKLGDRSDYSYYLGSIYTDFIQSGMFANGVGFKLSGNATAAEDDKYSLTIKDVGWAYVPFTTTQQSDASLVDTDTDQATAQLKTSDLSIGATAAAGFLLFDCGAALTNERCFTEITKSVEYLIKYRIGNQYFVGAYVEAEADSNGNYIAYFPAADEVSITVRFKYTYAFRHVGDTTSGTYRLYVRGTDYLHNRTDCFAASMKSATLNASGITVMNGSNGARITSGGVQTTSDGGATWQ